MTLPNERLRALKCGKQFLYDLINPKSTPRVPKEVRQRALWVLRHYPDDYHIDLISERLPEWFNDNPFPNLVTIQEKSIDK